MLVFSQQTLPLEGKDFSNYLQGGKLKRTHGATSSKTRRSNVLECKQITIHDIVLTTFRTRYNLISII